MTWSRTTGACNGSTACCNTMPVPNGLRVAGPWRSSSSNDPKRPFIELFCFWAFSGHGEIEDFAKTDKDLQRIQMYFLFFVKEFGFPHPNIDHYFLNRLIFLYCLLCFRLPLETKSNVFVLIYENSIRFFSFYLEYYELSNSMFEIFGISYYFLNFDFFWFKLFNFYFFCRWWSVIIWFFCV